MTTPGILPPNPIDWRNLIQAGRDLLNPRLIPPGTAAGQPTQCRHDEFYSANY